MPFDKTNFMQEIGRVIGKYLFPGLLILLGVTLLIISSGQTMLYVYGGIGILLVGVLSLLYVKGMVSLKAQLIITVVVGLGAVFFSFMDYEVINDELILAEEREKVKIHVVQRLKDIRQVEVAYLKEKGMYTDNFDTLMDFLDNGRITVIKRLGALPDSVTTEEEARELGLIQKMPEGITDAQAISMGIIVRDTLLVSAKSIIFDEDDSHGRKSMLYTDSLPFVPFSDHKFIIKTATVETGGVRQAAILVQDPKPFDKQFKFGSITEASTSGNWTE